jgi:transposase InsO family protein
LISKKKSNKNQLKERARLLYYNKGLKNYEIAEVLNCSTRTVIRWKFESFLPKETRESQIKSPRHRLRHFDSTIFDRIHELKEKNPGFTATLIYRQIQEEFKIKIPSESTVRKFLVMQGFHFKKVNNREGYIKFQRDAPNELWQIDIAGGQMIKGLGMVYLVAILDDCSRYIVGAQYFLDQKGKNVIQVIRDAVITYGRPQELFADNGTQFKNTIGENNTQYVNLLISIDIKPIFARKHHPQSKGKIERIFGTVIQEFLLPLRATLEETSKITISELNQRLKDWIQWYNEKKPHRSLPHRKPPAILYWDDTKRMTRPLETQVDWNQWLNAYDERKINKYNEILYQTHNLKLPPGYVGCVVDVLPLEDRFEMYHHGQLICTVKKNHEEYYPSKAPIFRTLAANGIFHYKSHWYSVDYKLAGKKVEIQEGDEGRTLLVYLDKILIKCLSVK